MVHIEDELTTFDALPAYWQKEEKIMRAYLDSLNGLRRWTNPLPTKPARYARLKIHYGSCSPMWSITAHSCRSEAAIILTTYHQSPGDLDMLYFFRLE